MIALVNILVKYLTNIRLLMDNTTLFLLVFSSFKSDNAIKKDKKYQKPLDSISMSIKVSENVENLQNLLRFHGLKYQSREGGF